MKDEKVNIKCEFNS